MYDQFGKEGLNGGGGTGFNGSDFFQNVNPDDLFSSIFGQQFSGNNSFKRHFHQQQKKEINHDIECSLEELYKGSDKQIFVENKKYIINVKPGWKEGTKITFNEHNYNITFIIKEKKHNIYTKINENLIIEHKVTLLDALKGFDTSIASINDKTNIVNVGPLVGSNVSYTLKGCGMPIRKKGQIVGYGDMIVKFIISLANLEYHHKQAILEILDK